MPKTFDEIIEALQRWRNEDHEDAITLTRHQIITLLEGINELADG